MSIETTRYMVAHCEHPECDEIYRGPDEPSDYRLIDMQADLEANMKFSGWSVNDLTYYCPKHAQVDSALKEGDTK